MDIITCLKPYCTQAQHLRTYSHTPHTPATQTLAENANGCSARCCALAAPLMRPCCAPAATTLYMCVVIHRRYAGLLTCRGWLYHL
jgi:hypothetical protein